MPQIIATVGEILVEFVSHVKDCGLERIGEYSGPYPSGAPAIFLDQAARMGACTEMFGGVGNDGFGRSVLNRLRDDGVALHGSSVSMGKATNGCIGVPVEFAEKLFEVDREGDIVEVIGGSAGA